MKPFQIRAAAVALVAACAWSCAFAAEEKATREQAVAMVKKGAAFIKSAGKDKAHAAISDKQGSFIQHDLYLVVYGLDGVVRAHGANDKMIGRNLMELRDVDGREFVKERVELARSKNSFWQDYKFTNPVSRKVEPKSMYCEKLDDAVVCGGVHR